MGGLFALLLSVSAEATVRGFGVEAQDLPLLVDPEREGRHRGPDEDSAIGVLNYYQQLLSTPDQMFNKSDTQPARLTS